MTNDGPFKKVLDRDFAVVSAAQLIEISVPLLRVVIDHATWAYGRCNSTPQVQGGPDEDMASISLYRHVIEMTDGIEVLVTQAAAAPIVPVLRSSFEATLALEYIMQGDYARRSLSWLHSYAQEGLKVLRAADPSTTEGIRFWSSLNSRGPVSLPEAQRLAQAIATKQALIGAPHLAAVHVEWQRMRARPHRKSSIPWYSLFGGPRSIRDLAGFLDRTSEYDILYRIWSRKTHAQHLQRIYQDAKGAPVITSMRNPEDIPQLVNCAVALLIRSTRLLLGHFRPSDTPSAEWYVEQVQPLWRRLRNTEVHLQFSDV